MSSSSPSFLMMSAGDASQHGKKLSANYLKHLFDIKNGGQCRVQNTMLHFKPLQPKIFCINDEPEKWLKAIDGIRDSDELPLEKRLLFVHVDELAIGREAVAKHEADLEAIVSGGKRRKWEYYSALDMDVSSPPSATTASGGESSAESSCAAGSSCASSPTATSGISEGPPRTADACP